MPATATARVSVVCRTLNGASGDARKSQKDAIVSLSPRWYLASNAGVFAAYTCRKTHHGRRANRG